VDKIKVLFLGTGDTARCEIAEGFLRTLAGDRFIAVSASTEPAQTPAESSVQRPAETHGQAPVQIYVQAIDPLAIEAMKEIGIDISQQRTKPVAEVFKEHFAYVVGVCDMDKERCPVFPFTYELLKWNIEDPVATQGPDRERIATFRRVRDSIEQKAREFIVTVSATVPPKAAAAGKSR
jgi:arsenate reductase